MFTYLYTQYLQSTGADIDIIWFLKWQDAQKLYF